MAKKNTKDKLFVDVVETAVEFHKRRLWNRVGSDDPISIRVEGEEHPILCFVLGSAGMELGLSALRGEHAMNVFEEVLLTGGKLSDDGSCDLLMLSFDMPSEVDDAYLRPLHQSGRVFGKGSAAPVFLGKPAGGMGHPMSRPELRIMLALMRTLLAAATSGQLLPRHWDWKRRTLELTLEGKGKKAKVLDSVVTWPPPRAEAEREVQAPVLNKRWYKVTKAADRTRATWGLVLIPAPPIDDDPRPREIMLVREDSSGSLFPPKLVLEGDPDDLASAIVDLIEEGPSHGDGYPGLPREIRFMSLRPMRQMQSALDEVSVGAILDIEQPELVEIVSSMTDAMNEGGEDEKRDGMMGPWKAADSRLSTFIANHGAAKGVGTKHRPLEQYFGDASAGLAAINDERDPTAGLTYMSWFLFRYRPRRGAPTAAERLRDQRRLPPKQQTLLEARIDAKLMVGRITAIDPGAWVELENVLTGEIQRVHDIDLSKSAREGIGLIVELYPVQEWTFAMMAGPPLPPMGLEGAIQQIEFLGHEFEDGWLGGDRTDLGELFLDRPTMTPVIRNTDGEDLVQLTVSFTLSGGATIASVLSGLPEMEDNENGEWTWLAPTQGRPGFENGVVIAHFEQVGDELLARVNSVPRSSRVKDLLSGLPGVDFLSTGPTPDAEPGASPMTGQVPPELQAHLEKLIHDQTMAWLDQSIPALGGKTPREAAADPTLAKDVERMIRTYPDAGSPSGPIRVPRQEMLEELGLD